MLICYDEQVSGEADASRVVVNEGCLGLRQQMVREGAQSIKWKGGGASSKGCFLQWFSINVKKKMQEKNEDDLADR